MKKMKVKNQEVNEIMNGLKAAGAAAIEFVAIVIAIPARIVLALAKWMDGVAQKLARNADNEVVTRANPERDDILAEITDV